MIRYRIQSYCVWTYLKWTKHIRCLALISLFVSLFTICSICQERPAQDESDHLTATWDCGYIGAGEAVQIIKNKAEPWLLFSAARLRAAPAHSGQDSLVASDSRNLGSQAGPAWEKMCEPQIGCWYPWGVKNKTRNLSLIFYVNETQYVCTIMRVWAILYKI